ncbi:tail fiber assembly protein [Citrobacter freundii]|uniref:Tail fiber assembly protein n=3 Tax=Citrobacter freundii TaxID=546 RepID=A0AAD1TV35_CITFR|nr:tail fiber assembly protein [Citrobacter freundii]CAF2790784.1 hypothetical protein AI2935V1_1774 [Citrobacter freundii]CAH6580296.1 hypothetical protein AI2935V1_1774 [Citrobacter freundii]
MNYFYSGSTNAFYPEELREVYEMAGTWPDDAFKVEANIADKFMQTPPAGKWRIADGDGLPAWGDIPPLTHEQITANAMQQKTMLLAEASAVIGPLKDASDGGYIDDADRPKLIAWQKYRYDLTKVDPAKPVWPQKPTE